MNDTSKDDTDSEFDPKTAQNDHNPHWPLLRRLISFQFKLIMDGLRDLLLSPFSIAFVLYGIVLQRQHPDKYFNRLLRFGRKSDGFINLFEAHNEPSMIKTDHVPFDPVNTASAKKTANLRSKNSDDYVKKLEELILTEYRKGGFITGIKHGTDDLLEKLQKKAKKHDD